MEKVQRHDLEYDMRHFIAFGKLIGVYPSKWSYSKLIPGLLAVVASVDWIGMLLHPSPKRHMTAVEICGRIGSPQFYTLGTFCYVYIQSNQGKLSKLYESWKRISSTNSHDTHLTLFINIVAGLIMTSAILENVSYHFKLFPAFEPPVQNKTSFEVYYERSHGYWAEFIPFTPFQATMLIITNKLALYAWNYADLLAIVTCRALRFHFEVLSRNIDVLGHSKALLHVQHQMELSDVMRLLEDYLSPLLFGTFYLDFYATCMQLHMWMTPSEHLHFLHTIYLLWAFLHLIVRVFLVSYHASRLHEISVRVQSQLQMISGRCSPDLHKQITRIEWSGKRQLAISGLGCFFITKRFILKLIYVAFSFQIFLLQSDTTVSKCELD